MARADHAVQTLLGHEILHDRRRSVQRYRIQPRSENATTTEPLSLEESAEKVTHNRLTQLNGIRWRYDIHGRTVEKDNGQTRWHYRYDSEHRLTEVISQPRDRNRPQTQVSFRYDPLGRRISKTRRQMLFGSRPASRSPPGLSGKGSGCCRRCTGMCR